MRILRLLLALAACLATSDPLVARAAPDPVPEQILRRQLDALDALRKELPRDHFSPEAIVALVGKDPERLFAFVRDETRLVPYRGVLRGPPGVLMDRVGNSLDRALLLARLVTLAGAKVRLAHLQLDASQVARLAPLLSTPLPAPARETDMPQAVVAKIKAEFGIDVGTDTQESLDAIAHAEKLASTAKNRVTSAADALLAAGVDAGAKSGGSDALVSDHWWVQWQRDGRWIALDPSLPEAEVGAAFGPAQETRDPAQLDASLFHEVDIRVVAETLGHGRFTERELLSHTVRPSELGGENIAFVHAPIDWREVDPNDTRAWVAALTAQAEWLPLLTIGAEVWHEQSVTTTGLVHKPDLGPASTGRSALRGADGLLGGLKNQGDRAPSADPIPPDGQLTAEWLEYRVRVPGQPVRVIRRDVFDLIGPAIRANPPSGFKPNEAQSLERALRLAGPTDVVVVGFQANSDAIAYRAAAAVIANRDALIARARKIAAHQKPDVVPAAVSMDGLGLAVARGVWGPLGETAFIDRPNIFASRGLILGDARGLKTCVVFDIVENAVGVRAGVPNPFRVRLEQGLVDTNAEALIWERCTTPENTAELYATTGGKPWVTLRTAAEVGTLALSEDVRARIGAQLQGGSVVVAPPDPILYEAQPAVAWWQIDPRTGTTLGIGRTGHGTPGAEKATLETKILLLNVGRTTYDAVQCASRPGISGRAFAGCIGVGLVGIATLWGTTLRAKLGIAIFQAILSVARNQFLNR